MIGLRKLHRVTAVWIAPQVLLQAAGGTRLRLDGTTPFFLTVHAWFKSVNARALEIPGAVVAVLLGLGLMVQAVTGFIMYVNLKVQQARRRARLKAPPPPPQQSQTPNG